MFSGFIMDGDESRGNACVIQLGAEYRVEESEDNYTLTVAENGVYKFFFNTSSFSSVRIDIYSNAMLTQCIKQITFKSTVSFTPCVLQAGKTFFLESTYYNDHPYSFTVEKRGNLGEPAVVLGSTYDISISAGTYLAKAFAYRDEELTGGIKSHETGI